MTEKLVGSGNSGDAILSGQGTAADKGFRNVSRYWYPKTLSYEQGLEQLEKEIDQRKDILCPVKAMTPIVNSDGHFALAHDDGREFTMNDWAMKQFATRANVPHTVINWLTQPTMKPNGTIRTNRDDKDAGLLVACFKNGLRHVDQKKNLRFRTYGESMRAVLTEDYSPVDNRWYMKVLMNLIPGGRLSHWRGDADTIYGNILIPDSIREENDSDYGGMLSIGNCEIGKRRISQFPSVFRAICMNGCIWDRTKGKCLNKVHKGIDLSELKVMIARNVQEQIPLTTIALDKLLETRTFDIPKVKHFIAEVGNQFKFSPSENVAIATEWNKFEKSDRNLFGIVNAITRAGQNLTNERWVDFDESAGNLIGLDATSFGRYVTRAGSLTDDEVNAAFGLAV